MGRLWNSINLTRKINIKATVEDIDEFCDDIGKLKLTPSIKPNAAKRLTGPQGVKGYGRDGTKFDSLWEYAFYLYNQAQGYYVQRNWVDTFPYIDENGKQRKFHPDFIVNGLYYEVKGILRPSDSCKMDQCPNVHFVFGDEIKEMMDFLDKHEPNWRKSYTPR